MIVCCFFYTFWRSLPYWSLHTHWREQGFKHRRICRNVELQHHNAECTLNSANTHYIPDLLCAAMSCISRRNTATIDLILLPAQRSSGVSTPPFFWTNGQHVLGTAHLTRDTPMSVGALCWCDLGIAASWSCGTENDHSRLLNRIGWRARKRFFFSY